MAQHLDLEEQEQLDALKHFWRRYGNWITGVLVVAMLAVLGWSGYQYWQRNQAAQAGALYDEVERAASAGDVVRVERAFSDIREKFGRTAYAQQAGLLAAKVQSEQASPQAAQAAQENLRWVAEKASDPGYQAIARLRLAALLVQANEIEPALQQLQGGFPKEFEALVADRQGDVLLLQGKTTEAVAAYTQAYQKFADQDAYRNLVAVKLNAQGVDPKSVVLASAAPAAEGSK